MRRSSIVDNVPHSRESSAGCADASSASMQHSCLENGSSRNSFDSGVWHRFEDRGIDLHRHTSSTTERRTFHKREDGDDMARSFDGSSGRGRMSLRSSRQSNRFPTIASRTGGPAAAPLEPGLRVMSVVVEKSNISFCCYNQDENEILIETCIASGYETEALVERFLQVARPNLVLVGSRIVNNTPLLDMMIRRPPVLSGNEGEGQEGETERSSIPYRLVKSSNFDFRKCKKIILEKLQVTSMLKQRTSNGRGRYNHHFSSERNFPPVLCGRDMMYESSRFHHLAAVIDFESKVLVQALGALLSYLQSTVFQLSEENYIVINRIVEAKSSEYMVLSPSTFSALHIFSTEHHPLIAKGQGHSKEGFSLFSLLDRTKCRGGRQLLREWMLKPLINLEHIRSRQDVIEFFLQPYAETHVGILLNLLPRVGSIDKVLLRFQKCAVKPQDFLVLITSISAAISVASVLRNDILSLLQTRPDLSTQLAFQFFSELCRQFNIDVLINLRERITNIIDSELMMESKGSFVAIRYGVDRQLDYWKDQYDSLEGILVEVAERLYHKHTQLDGLSVVFLPQIGYLVKLDNLITYSQVVLPPDFERIFIQDSDIYFKCDEMRNLDHEIGDLDGLIKDAEQLIVNALEEDILATENELRDSFKALSTLDCILSFANCAADLNFTRPHVIDGERNRPLQSQHSQDEHRRQVVYIKDGRHPLQEIICEREFVKNDVKIDDLDRIICVTGPNFSGKSCYMRQVGLLVYMAHLGSFIPCSEAVISITDQIFARVSTTETCSRPQSSYQLELTEMASILLKATQSSLVLIDEFGKGTNPASGIAVLGAALKKLSKIQCKAVCTTHFLELFTMNVIQDGRDGIRARRMTIHLPEGDQDGAASLFKLEDGVASSSAGLVCAKHAGVSNVVIDRAKEIIETLRARKGIEPIPDATKQVPILSEAEKEILANFVSVDSWEDCEDDDIIGLLQQLANPNQK